MTAGSVELVHLTHHAGLPGAVGLASTHGLCSLPGLQHSWVGYGVGAVGHMMMWHVGLGRLGFLFVLLRDGNFGDVCGGGLHVLHPHCVKRQAAFGPQLRHVAVLLVVVSPVHF